MIPYGRQFIDEADIEAVVAVLRSDFITQGPAIARFEEKVAEFCGAKHAVAVANATAALHLGALALGLEPGDRLWTSPNTFIASANCALYCGGRVDFVDIDPRTYNLSAIALKAKLEAAAEHGTLPKVLVPVHFSGQPCEMEAIASLARAHGVRVMEDASHAIAIVQPHGKVPEMIDDVIRLHDGVPGTDQRFIHVADVGERPVAGCRCQHQRM